MEKYYFSGMGAAIAVLIGGFDTALQCLIIMFGIEIFSGIAIAAQGKSHKTKKGGLSSGVLITGIFKKITILFFVVICEQIDRILGVNYLRDASLFFFIANEGLSFIENAGLLGVPIPPKLKEAIEVLKDGDRNGK